jgi:hypothetical protein
MDKELIVLAFDVEATGQQLGDNGVGEVIALGVKVLGEDLKILDGMTIGAYRKRDKNNKKQFEKRCWDEFWSKHQDKLSKFEFDPKMTVVDRAKQMTLRFQQIRTEWEIHCHQNNLDYEIVSDNKIYDGEKMNQLITRFTDDIVLPYSASKYATKDDPRLLQRYENFPETTSMKKGFLIGYNLGKEKKIQWKDIETEFDIPKSEFEHDHMPENDAYAIARERQILRGIETGRFKKRTHEEAFDVSLERNKIQKMLGQE